MVIGFCNLATVAFLDKTIKNEIDKLQQSKKTDTVYNISYFGELSESKKIELNSLKEEFFAREVSDNRFIKDNKYVIEIDYNKELESMLVKLVTRSLFVGCNFEYLMIDPNKECFYLDDSELYKKIKEVLYTKYIYLRADEQKIVYCIIDIFRTNDDNVEVKDIAVSSHDIKDFISKGYMLLMKTEDCYKIKGTWLEDIIYHNKESFLLFKE